MAAFSLVHQSENTMLYLPGSSLLRSQHQAQKALPRISAKIPLPEGSHIIVFMALHTLITSWRYVRDALELKSAFCSVVWSVSTITHPDHCFRRRKRKREGKSMSPVPNSVQMPRAHAWR